MDLTVQISAGLLFVATIVAILTRRLRLPYSVGLVAAGILVALLPFSPQVGLTRELLFSVLLPPLIFEAAFNLHWKELRKDLAVVLLLATLGVVFSAAVTALGMHSGAGWPWVSALTFGVLIAATDPVSVIATFREAKVRGRLLLLVESESLFNDGTAAVLFSVCLAYAAGNAPTAMGSAAKLLITIGGSLACGAAVGVAALMLAGHADDHLVEITVTAVAAYGSFLLAEHFQLSGVLATLVAGLILGNTEAASTKSGPGREAVEAFWEFAAFLANSLVFLMIGMREARQHFLHEWRAVALAVLLVLLGRAAAVYPCCAVFSRSSLRVSLRHQHVLVWGGLRGALSLALALALPETLPKREVIVTASFAVVAFSVFAQGLSLTPLLHKFGEIPKITDR